LQEVTFVLVGFSSNFFEFIVAVMGEALRVGGVRARNRTVDVYFRSC
jgi:hypothetical protein